MLHDKYLFALWGDGTTRYIFRMDKNGTILRADLHGTVYYPINLSDVPQRVIYEFRDASRLMWEEEVTEPEVTPSWGRAENAADTGITDDEFIALVLERIPTSKYEYGQFYMITEINNKQKYKKIPNSLLRYIAKSNKYFGNTYWMVE